MMSKNSQINRNMFTIRYYTWPDTMTKPTISRGNDDWCFMKQDSTRITSSTISNTKFYYANYYTIHDSIQIPETNFVN